MPVHRVALDPGQLASVRASRGPMDILDIRAQGAAHRIWSVYGDIKEQVNQPQCTCKPKHRGHCQLAERTDSGEGETPPAPSASSSAALQTEGTP